MPTQINYNQPYFLLPNRVWRTYQGGRVLDQIEGKPNAADSHFPEDWVGSTTRAINVGREHLADEGIGFAQNANGDRFSMADLFTTSPVEALGAAHVAAFGPQPQLLVKLLDSAMRLHIQAHPNVAWARRHLNASSGKTEAWWILQTRTDDAYVYLGFQHPPAPDEWRRIVDAQDFEAMFRCFEPIPVVAGDVLLVAGGVPHAIGPGITMVEIQEPTDYVVRCEYAHGGITLPESARTMGLGLERVLDLFDYAQYPAQSVKTHFGPRLQLLHQSAGGTETALLAAPQTDRIEVRKIECAGTLDMQFDHRFSILIVLDGAGSLHANGVTLPLQPWSRVFLPAAVRAASISGQLTVARCLPPSPS